VDRPIPGVLYLAHGRGYRLELTRGVAVPTLRRGKAPRTGTRDLMRISGIPHESVTTSREAPRILDATDRFRDEPPRERSTTLAEELASILINVSPMKQPSALLPTAMSLPALVLVASDV
jgi:hypothetical protein